MSIPLLLANALTLLAFFVHTFVGDQELQVLIARQAKPDRKYRSTWTMARCGWHWISIDLLIASVVMLCINFLDVFPHESTITLMLAVFFTAYGAIWLLTTIISPPFKRRLFLLGQWLLLFIIGGLLFLAV